MNKYTQGLRIVLITFMITFAFLFFFAGLVGCQKAEFGFKKGEPKKEKVECYLEVNTLICSDGQEIVIQDTDTDTTCTIVGNEVQCPDGTTLVIQDQVNLTQTDVPTKNGCYPISHGLYVEVIRNAEVYDVYMDSSCRDFVNGNLNEVCDNNEPAFGAAGQVGFGLGGTATVCPYNNSIIYGHILNDVLTISVLEVLQ